MPAISRRVGRALPAWDCDDYQPLTGQASYARG